MKKVKSIIIAVLALGVIGLLAYTKISGQSLKGLLHRNDPAFSVEEMMNMGISVDHTEEHKNTDSDIEGMTVYDKREAGLDIHNGSDTDKDGLTDKAEIEEYGSDPLKVSTSGDLYSDGYKAEHGMDLFTQYDYKDDLDYPKNNLPNEVFLTADTADDFLAEVFVNGFDFELDIPNHEIIKSYSINFYNGPVSIDISGIDTKDLEIFMGDGFGKEEKVEYTISGNLLTPNKEISTASEESELTNCVTLTRKTGFSLKSMLSSGSSLDNLDIAEENEFNAYGMTSYMLSSNGLFTPQITYTTSGDEEIDKAMLQDFKKYLVRDLLDRPLFGNEYAYSPDDVKVFCESPKEFKETYERVQKIPFAYKTAKVCGESPFAPGAWLQIVDFDASMTESLNNVEGKVFLDPGFDVKRDMLPFPNCASKYIKGGNCVGFSHLTSLIFNQKEMNHSGTNHYLGVWDLAIDPENKTLIDPVLSDYKTASFTDDHIEIINGEPTIAANLTPGEDEFLKMLGSYAIDGNLVQDGYIDKYDEHDLMKKVGDRYSWDLIMKALEYLNDGKILDMSMYYYDPNLGIHQGHAVNIVGWGKINKNYGGDVVEAIYFDIADSNFPGSVYKGMEIDTRMIILRHADNTFDYVYHPFKDYYDYFFSSLQTSEYTNYGYGLIIYDDHFDILNNKL